MSDQDDWSADDTAEAPVPEQPSAAPVDQDAITRRGGQAHFASVDQWVTGWLLPMWSRDLHGEANTWCPQWWRHPRSGRPAHRAVAGMGEPTPRPGHRHVLMVARPR